MAALQFVDVPGYAAAIFRRSKVEHLQAEAPLARAKAWLAPAIEAGRVRYTGDAGEQGMTFVFDTKPGEPPAILHFGYLAREADRTRYQGAAFQFIGVDEVGFWRESDYRWLFSRLRGPKHWRGVVPNRMRCTANPGGPGHRWVKARFVERARHVARGSDAREDVAARRRGVAMPAPSVYESPPTNEAAALAAELDVKPQGAFFVPSFAADNPAIDLVDYRLKLARLSPVEREWFEWGNWDAEPTGGFFRPEHFEFVDRLPEVARWVRGWDFAATEFKPGTDPDWSAGVKCGGFRDDRDRFRLVVGNVERWRDEPGPTEARARGIVSRDGVEVLQVLEQEPGGAGKAQRSHWATSALVGYALEFERRTGPKAAYWKPISGAAEHVPIIVLRADWTDDFVDELKALPVGHDDQADALAIAYPRVARPGLVLW